MHIKYETELRDSDTTPVKYHPENTEPCCEKGETFIRSMDNIFIWGQRGMFEHLDGVEPPAVVMVPSRTMETHTQPGDDVIGSTHYQLSYCPMCGSQITFEETRRYRKEIVEVGVD